LVVEGLHLGFNDLQGGLEGLWIPGAGSAEESGILQRHGQRRVERSRGLEDPKLPLSAPSGALLAPTSPKLVEGFFSEVRKESCHKYCNWGIRSPSSASMVQSLRSQETAAWRRRTATCPPS